jgi:hypothetical protein
MMMALLPRALEGAGAVATTRPPARRTGLGTVRTACAPVAHAEGQARARAGAAPQRDVDGGSLRGDGGACCDHVTARMVRRRRRVRRRAAEMYGWGGRQRRGRAELVLGAFRRRLRPSLLGIPFCLDIAHGVVVSWCRGLAGSVAPRRSDRLALLRPCLDRATWQVVSSACASLCVQREREPCIHLCVMLVVSRLPQAAV